MVPRTFLFIFHAAWRRLSSNNFRNSSLMKKRPVRPVFPDYLSVSYDYDYFKITSWFIDVICNHSDCIKISILLKMNFKNFMYKLLRNVYKGNTQFIFLFHPQKSGTSQVRITFLQLTQKIQTKDIFHWLELITEILSFLQIFSVRKITTQLF